MAMIPTVIKSQPMADTATTDTSQAMAKNPMVTKSPHTADTITTDTSRPMAAIPTVTKIRCMADTKSIVMVILTDTKNPTERSTTPATLIIPSKKSVNMLMLKKTTKKQSLNIKYSYDAVPTEYDYVEKYGWGRPTTIGSLYNGYGYGNQYPQQYGY